MRDWVRRALTRTFILPTKGRGKQVKKYQLPPSEALVWGCVILLIFFTALIALQALHLIVTGKFSAEVWGGIMTLIGVFVGAFFGGRA